MNEFFQSREKALIRDLNTSGGNVEKIDRIISFVIEVRSTLLGKVEFWIKEALPLCREESYDKGLFALYVHLAFYYLMTSDYPLGKSYLDKASRIDWSRFLHSREHMYFYHAHGLYYHFMGEKDLAVEYFEKSLELARNLRDSDFTSQMLNNLSSFYTESGEYQKGEALLLEAFAGINPEKNPFPALKIMDNLAYLYIQQGEYDKAVDYLESALSYAQEKSVEYMLPPINYNYGIICEKRGEVDRAEELYREAYENNGETYFMEEIPLGYSRFLFEQGRREEGIAVTDKLLELFRRKGMTGSMDKVYHLMDEYDI